MLKTDKINLEKLPLFQGKINAKKPILNSFSAEQNTIEVKREIKEQKVVNKIVNDDYRLEPICKEENFVSTEILSENGVPDKSLEFSSKIYRFKSPFEKYEHKD